MTNRHIPVLLRETLEAFEPLHDRPAILVDGTLGGAGHTTALLNHSPHWRLLGCDVDSKAIEAAREKLGPFVQENRLSFFNGNFSGIVASDAAIPSGFTAPWDGILLDLGYSSNQLEDAAYGMSFSLDAPLDMRLARTGAQALPHGQSAWDLINEATAQELGDILKTYGEMPGAHLLARRIKEALESGELENSTMALAEIAERILPKRHHDDIHPATLVFQALRIAVNDELRALDRFLENVILKLSPRARLAIITFHSLEDRLVKQWGKKHLQAVRAITKKPLMATTDEVKANPRARSAKLRVYEKF